jgi:hypothetical protein
MHLLNFASVRHCDSSLDHVYGLLHPRTDATEVVQDVPILRNLTCSIVAAAEFKLSPVSLRVKP